MLYEEWECFKDLLRLRSHRGLQKWMIVQIFNNRVMRSMSDATAGSTFMNKIEGEAYNLIEEMALNNYQWLEVGNGLGTHWVKRIGPFKRINNGSGQ